MAQFITYAQNNEDVILAAYFKDVTNGTYVDVGANHPVQDSVTKHFYLHGWRGINIEPINYLYEKIVADRPEDINVKAGIADKPGTLQLREYKNHGLSTFSDDIKELHSDSIQPDKTADYTDVNVKVMTLKELFDKYKPKHIHFLKVDVEGLEYEVLKGNDWKKYRPEMLCIESNHDVAGRDWRSLVKDQGYTKVWNDGLNDYYLAKESMHRKDNFDYATVMLLSDQILPYHVIDRIHELQQELHDAQIKLEVQTLKSDQLELEAKEAHRVIDEQKRFRNAAKLLIRATDNVAEGLIERLNAPKKGGPLQAAIKPSEFNAASEDALLADIRNADMQAYYSVKPPRKESKAKLYTYKALKGSYVAAKRGAAKAARGAIGLVKKGK